MNNNKKYIIITPCITNMGGAQMYVRNKYIYMHDKGWDVDILTAQKGKIYIADLKKFNCVIPELGFNIYEFTKLKQEKIVNEIIKRIIDKTYDEIIIESTCISESTWSEVIAQRLNARHFFFNLQEHDSVTSKTMQEFLVFKYRRRELAGIVEKSLYNLFLPFHPILKEDSYFLPAYCNNVVEDIPCSLLKGINIEKYNHIIGCISRLDKPFIFSAINDFISYVNQYTDKKYLLLMIGGAPEGSTYEQKIRNLFNNISNTDIIITGYMFPIPAKLLDIFNAFFTSAGSVWVCWRSGVPTISYDTNDYRPIGIMGRTTNNSLMRDKTEPIQDFSKLMDDILGKKIFNRESPNQLLNKPNFTSHDEFIESMCKEKEYFNFDRFRLNSKELKLFILLGLLGADNYTKLGAWKNRLLTTFK